MRPSRTFTGGSWWAPVSLCCPERIRRRRSCGRGISQEQCDRPRKPAHQAVYAALTPKEETTVNFSQAILLICLSDQRNATGGLRSQSCILEGLADTLPA